METIYKKYIEARFDFQGETFKLTRLTDDALELSETRFNGQEDDHKIAYLVLNEQALWEFEDNKIPSNFLYDYNREDMKELLKLINENPLPEWL